MSEALLKELAYELDKCYNYEENEKKEKELKKQEEADRILREILIHLRNNKCKRTFSVNIVDVTDKHTIHYAIGKIQGYYNKRLEYKLINSLNDFGDQYYIVNFELLDNPDNQSDANDMNNQSEVSDKSNQSNTSN